mmetsp:Transcript_87638/g.151811  ORF Transcript_87638/g.151811 Transcript_87638/m.151811 type:complete len:641 (+) Transcript_87638:168-2090(+)
MVAERCFVARLSLLVVLACLTAAEVPATNEIAACAVDETTHNGVAAECTTLLQLVTDVHVRSSSPALSAAAPVSGDVDKPGSTWSEELHADPSVVREAEAHVTVSHGHGAVHHSHHAVLGELILALGVLGVLGIATAMFFLPEDGLIVKGWKSFLEWCKRTWCCLPCVRCVQRLQGCVRRGLWFFSPESTNGNGGSRPDIGGGGPAGSALSTASLASSARSSTEGPLTHSYRNNLGRPPREDAEARLNSMDGRQRLRTVTLLLVGSCSALMGFVLVAMLNFHRYFYEAQRNVLGEPFKSGHHYWPRTINEQVDGARSARDKVFFCFGLLSSICLLLSWYPWELRNVYVSNQARFLTQNSCLWLNFRQYVPTIGLFIISCVSTTPRGQAGLKDQATIYVHLLGMTMFVLGYIFAEAYTLYFTSVPDIRTPERKIRKACIVGCTVSTVIWQFCSLLLISEEELGLCCTDDWHVPTSNDVLRASNLSHFEEAAKCLDAMQMNRRELFNTAWGWTFFIKFIEYWMQLCASIFICVSLLAIWWYCPERNMAIDEAVSDVDEALVEKEELGHSRFAQALAGKMPRFPFLPIVRPQHIADANMEMSCSQCGTVFVPDSRFCDSCGSERRPIHHALEPTPPGPPHFQG